MENPILSAVQQAAVGLPLHVTSADKVYKDECMFSFDNAENTQFGLDTCMSCFQAFARADHKDYTAEHYSRKGHPLFVTVKKSLKRQTEAAEPAEAADEEAHARKVPKLEIVEQKESDLYDTATDIYVAPFASSVAVESCPESVQKLASEILSANSASVADDIKAWESEVFPCEHSLTICSEIPEPTSTLDLSQCSMCELKENLWICLTCGALGCGREQFGSSIKGNSHALTHYELTGHQVAVKLGSLSADNEDSCDCYCYQCNDEVKVPELTAKLRPFGVDLSSAVKSEKSLVELNLDTNKNWQFNLDGAGGEKLAPVFGPGLTGLSNLGNSCYLNSVVQALFSLEPYQRFFANKSFENVPDAAVDLPSQMLKLHDGLCSGRYSKPSALKGEDYQAGIKPSSFKALIGADHHEFKTNRQQDANEFLLYLFDKLDNQFGLALNKDFKFLLGSKVICSSCKHGSRSSNLVDNVSVPLRSNVLGTDEEGKKIYEEVTLADSLQAFAAKEGIESFACDKCGEKNSTTKQEGFVSFPEYLVVSVQRIALENWVPVKQEVPVAIPEEIDLSGFVAPTFAEGEIEESSGEKAPETDTFVPNQEALSTLLSMGFSEPRCLRALYNTGNSDAEEAMNWVFAHMDDADIDDPFDPSQASAGKTDTQVSPEAIENLASMGFSALLAKKALVLNNSDINASVEWLFSNPDDDGIMTEESTPAVNLQAEIKDLSEKLLGNNTTGSGKYTLKAAICHKGTSPHTGHYVAFIRHKNKWVLFNDEKVVDCGENVEDIKKNAYVYIFQRA